MAKIWVFAETTPEGEVDPAALEILSKAREVGDAEAVVLGPGATKAAEKLGEYGAATVYASDDEVYAAALQYVRKISGSTKPSQANEEAFNRAVDEIAHVSRHLLEDLVSTAPPKNREVEAEKAKARSAKRFAAA